MQDYWDSPEYQEREKQNMAHSNICFGGWLKCISCGCYRPKGIACVSHRDTRGYQNYLMEEMIKIKRGDSESPDEIKQIRG